MALLGMPSSSHAQALSQIAPFAAEEEAASAAASSPEAASAAAGSPAALRVGMPPSADTSMALESAEPSISDGTTWRAESDIRRGRMVAVVGGIVAADVIGVYKLARSWYDAPRSGFHLHDMDRDLREYKQQDKFGHAFSAYYLGLLSSQAYRWAGLSSQSSIWLGGTTSFIGLLQVEIVDGFYQNWGFSVLDLGMNALGSGLAVAQQLDPHTFGGLRFKMSYWPSQAYRDGLYPSYSDTIVDDYEGRIFWLAVNAHGVLPTSWRDDLPGWLKPWGVAVGNGASGIANDVFGGERHVYLALDLDLAKIPVGNSRILQFLRSQANFIHMPLPGVRFSSDGPTLGFFF